MSILTPLPDGKFRFAATADDAERRIDQVLSEALPSLSRNAAARHLRDGRVTIDGHCVLKPSTRVEAGAVIEVTPEDPGPSTVEAEDLPLRILHQDADIAVVDKPAGLVVHPAAGHRQGTLVNALLHHLNDLSGVGGELRPGIVHRLDKDTSGLLVVAKNDQAHRTLTEMWNTPAVRKIYLALAYGLPRGDEGTIDRPIGRHPRDRKKMTIVESGRSARTSFRVIEHFNGCSLLELELHTGRTHQIRVHLQSIGHPVVGDPVYSGAQWKGIPDRSIRDALRTLDRQALHASRLEIAHPTTSQQLVFDSPLPRDLQTLIDRLRRV